MRPVVISVGPLAPASATAVATSQSVVGAGPVTINGSRASSGIATLDAARRVVITSAGNDSSMTFTILGTNWSGRPVSELLVGGNAASVTSALDYLTVTSILTSGSTASTVTVGTNAVGSSQWFRTDDYGTTSFAMQLNVTGTATGTLQSSLDDPNSIYAPVAPALMTWINHPDPSCVGFTTSFAASYTQSPGWIRILLTAGTGYITGTIIQGGSPPA